MLDLADMGQGCPDFLVGYRGRNQLFEIKDGSRPPSARKLTDDEQDFHDSWRGDLCIVKDVDEALLELMGMGV